MAKKNTNQTINDVRSADLRVAEEAIAKGVQESQERWVEAGLIAQALTAELVKIAQNSGSKPQIATFLRLLHASSLSTTCTEAHEQAQKRFVALPHLQGFRRTVVDGVVEGFGACACGIRCHCCPFVEPQLPSAYAMTLPPATGAFGAAASVLWLSSRSGLPPPAGSSTSMYCLPEAGLV